MKTIIILCLTCCSITCFSQKHDHPESNKWLIDSSLYLSDSTAVSNLVFSGDKAEIAFLDENGNVSSELSVPGRVLGLSKWKGNVVAFYADQWDTWKVIKNVHALLIDVKTRTIRQDQPLFTNPGKYFIICQVRNDDQGNFGCFLIRTTFLERADNSNRPKVHGLINGTSALTAMYLSDDFHPVSRSLTTALIRTVFFGSYVNRKGELAILSYWNNQIVAEKFGTDGQLQKKATVSFTSPDPWGTDENLWARGAFRPGSDNIMAFSVYMGVFVVDFGSEKAWALETPAANDKDYNDRINRDPEAKKTHYFKYAGSFKPDCLFFNGDTLIYSKEIQYWQTETNNTTRWMGAGTMVTVYDGKFQWIHNFYLDRYFEAFLDGGYRWSYKVQNGKLLAYGNAVTKPAHYENICYIADLHTFTLGQKTMDWGDVSHQNCSEPSSVLWFRDNLLKNPSMGLGFFGHHIESCLVKIAFP